MINLFTLQNITLFTEVIPLIFCVFFYSKLNTSELKVFFAYTISQTIFSFFCFKYAFLDSSFDKYLATLNLHLIAEFVLMSIFFIGLIEENKVKKIIITIIPLFLIYNIFAVYLNYQPIFRSQPTLFEFLFFMGLIIYYFFEKLIKSDQILIYKNIYFWISVGLFFYFSGNFFYMLLVEYSPGMSAEGKSQLKIIYSAVTISKNLILGLSFLASVNPTKKNDDNLLPQDLDLDTIKTNSSIN